MASGKRRLTTLPTRHSDTWLRVLAGIGFGLSAYLMIARVVHAPLYCPLGSGCDVVQSSRYAQVFGVPLAGLGLGFYGMLLALGILPLERTIRWRLALPITAVGVTASLVFTVVQYVRIRATCSLCLVSAALALGLFVLVTRRLPPRPSPRTWVWSGLAAVVALVTLTGSYTLSAPQAGAPDYAEGLATHLTRTGAKFYGAYWCPHCADQKAMFGPAAGLLPYIECDPRSPIGQPQVCLDRQVRAYPTWEIAGQRFEGVLSLEDLARLSGYPPPPKATAR